MTVAPSPRATIGGGASRPRARPRPSEYSAAHPVCIIGAGFMIDLVAPHAYSRDGIKVVAIASRHAGRA
jgi:hypothetical protein